MSSTSKASPRLPVKRSLQRSSKIPVLDLATQYSGISFEEEFLKCSPEVSDEDTNALRRRVEEKIAHISSGCKFQSRESSKYAEKLEAKMYKPFAEIANMVQERSENRIKTHPSTGDEYVKGDRFAERKPDVSLAPEKVGDEETNSDTLRRYYMLCVLAFKKSQSRKHSQEEEASDLEFRKWRSITTGEPTSAISASVDGTAYGICPSIRGLGTVTRTSSDAKAFDAGPSTGWRGTAADPSTGTLSQSTGLRRSPPLATSSPQSYTLPNSIGTTAQRYNPVGERDDHAFCDIIPQFATYVRALYSERELFHRDMSFANIAYHVENGRKIATLIDFDLATFPNQTSEQEGTDPPDATGLVSGSALPSVVLDTPMASDAPGAPASLSTAAIAGRNGKCQDRSGTTPFMAIETLDLNFPGYVHHVCHELESLFYATVWHGVGHRWTKGLYPYATDLARQKKVDILRGWTVGSWSDIADRKDLFLTKAETILQYMKHPELQDICWNLSILFQQRMTALRGCVRARKVAATSAGALKRQAVKRRAMNFVYNQPVFPTFADIWGFERVECQKSCCVN